MLRKIRKIGVGSLVDTVDEQIVKDGLKRFVRLDGYIKNCITVSDLLNATLISLADDEDKDEITDRDVEIADKVAEYIMTITGKDAHIYHYPAKYRRNSNERQFFVVIYTGDNGHAKMSNVLKQGTDVVEFIENLTGWCSVVDFSNDIPDNVQCWLLTYTVE